jgi:hypothetical protein
MFIYRYYSIPAPSSLMLLAPLAAILAAEEVDVGLGECSDGHTFVYSLHRYRYRYIVSNYRYKRTPSVICL